MPSPTESDLAALERFVVENDDLLELEATIGRFNIFDALRIERAEIRHSNFLAWLLTPSESHGQGDLFLKAVVMDVLRRLAPDVRRLSIVDLDGADLHGVQVRREYQNIDILVICERPRFVMAFENKIDSDEHSGQLGKYGNRLDSEFAGAPVFRVLLSPDGRAASLKPWLSYSYGDLHRVLTRVQRTAGGSLGGDVGVFLQHYLQLIGSRMMDDPRLDELCARIYQNHRRAIDLIIERIPTGGSAVGGAVRAWLEERPDEWRLRTRGTRYIQVVPVQWVGTLSTGEAERHPDAPCDLFVEMEAGAGFLASRLVVGPCEPQVDRRLAVQRIADATGMGMQRKAVSPTWTRLGSTTLMTWATGDEPADDQVRTLLTGYMSGLRSQLAGVPESLRGLRAGEGS